MLQKEIESILGVSKSSLKEWISNSSNKKHNLGVLLSALDTEAVLVILSKIKKNRSEIIGLEELKSLLETKKLK